LPPTNNVSAAELTNLKSKGKLSHPNIIFFKFIGAVEDCFMKNIKSSDVYNKTVDDLILHVLNTNMRYLPMQLSIT